MMTMASSQSNGSHGAGDRVAMALTPGSPLPDLYGEAVLVLLPRDPHWMFAYWELPEALWHEAERRWGSAVVAQAEPALRVHDVTGLNFPEAPSHQSLDIPITLTADNWHIHVPQSGRSYCVELGLKTADGRFLWLLRSNVVHLPLGRVSDVVDDRWMRIDQETFEKLLERFGNRGLGGGSAELVRRLAKRWERSQAGFSWPGGSHAR